MEIIVKRRAPGPPSTAPRKIAGVSPFDGRFGEWGKVDVSYSDDNTVDIFLDSGVYLKRVPVASGEWVVSGEDAEKGYNSGERNLPPVHARVFVIMPTRTYNDCFIAPFSGFSMIDQTEPYMGGDKEKIKERITPGGRHITDDYVTGSHKSVSQDEKTSLEIDYGTEKEPKEDAPELHLSLFDEIKADVVTDDNVTLSVFDEAHIEHVKGERVTASIFEEIEIEHVKGDSCTVKVFDTEIVIKPGEVSIKPKETTIEVDGGATIKTSGDTIIEAAGDVAVKGTNINAEASVSATVKAAKAQITGGQLTVNGASAPSSGTFCALPVCLVTGSPHTGSIVSGT
jgi:hypothetical protein